MASLERNILEDFVAALKSEGISKELAESLETVLNGEKKLKPEEIAQLFVPEPGEVEK